MGFWGMVLLFLPQAVWIIEEDNYHTIIVIILASKLHLMRDAHDPYVALVFANDASALDKSFFSEERRTMDERTVNTIFRMARFVAPII